MEETDQYICYDCIGEKFLSAEIEIKGKVKKCDYCAKRRKSYALERICDRVEVAFRTHYERTSSEPSDWEYAREFVMKDPGYHWYRSGETVVDILVNEHAFLEAIAGDVREFLADRHFNFEAESMGDENEFGNEVCYEENGVSGERWQQKWEEFGQILKTESRFFNEKSRTHLENIFEDIHEFGSYSSKDAIKVAGPDLALNHLYRARVFQSEDRLLDALCRPDLNIGAPPSHLAMSGRMNARGISVFYGATHHEAALAEVRPPVGSDVVVARFDISRKLRLLNLPAILANYASGSVFDPAFMDKREKSVFLRHFSKSLVRPVLPEEEDFGYLPTQAVADFLASNTALDVDGIIFPSVQSDRGLNVVLFQKASRCAPVEIKKNHALRAYSKSYDEEDEYTSYKVVTYKNRPVVSKKEQYLLRDNVGQYYLAPKILPAKDDRALSLKVDLESLTVHRIEGLEIKKTSHFVDHRTAEKMSDKKPDISGISDLF